LVEQSLKGGNMPGSQGALIVMLLVGISFAVFWSGDKEQPLTRSSSRSTDGSARSV
jgi:flagellar basal body-associated protein FliL